jgi:hypothetical protein
MSDPRCGDSGGVTREGSPCRSRLNLSPDTGLCLQHDPARREAARAMQSAGAIAKAEVMRRRKAALPAGVPRAPRTLEDAERVASWITRAVLVGDIDVRVAEAATKAVRQFQLVVEKRVLQDRVRELELMLREARK